MTQLAVILAQGENPAMLLLAMGGLIFLLWWTSIRRRPGSDSPRFKLPKADKPDPRELLHRTHPQITAAMTQLEELTREMMGQLDTRFAKLEHVLGDADRRIDELQAMLRALRGIESLEITVDDEGDSRHASVLRLSRDGLSPAQIAQQAGMPIGEVELILSLQRARRQATPGDSEG